MVRARCAAPSPERLTWADLGLAFWNPVSLAKKLRHHWSWLPAYGTAVLALAANSWLIGRLAPNNAQLTGGPLVWLRTILVVSLVVSPLLTPILQAFFLALGLTFVSYFNGVRTRFSKLFSIAMWALLPAYGLGVILNSIVLPMVPPESWGRIALGPAVFFEIGTWAHRVLRFFDISNIIALGLLWVFLGYAHNLESKRARGWMLGVGALWMTLAVSFAYS